MSFADLKKIAEQSAVVQVSTRNTRNVPLLVSSYDLEAQTVTGVDLFNNEDVTIRLRPDPLAKRRPHPRSEIADFAGAGRAAHASPVHTTVGGVIVFDYAYPEPDERGVMNARWGHSYSHFEGENDVFVAYAAPFVSSRGKFAMDVARTIAAAPVNSVEELRLRIEDALHSQFAGAVIRASDGNETVMYSNGPSDRIERVKVIDGKPTTLSVDEAIEDFFATPFGQVLTRALGDGESGFSQDFVLEVLPVERVYASRDTQTQIATKENLERWHQMGTSVGYTPTIMAVRHDDEGRMFLVARPMPVDTLPALYQLKYVPTTNISPRVAPYVSSALGNAVPSNDGISAELEAAFGGQGLSDDAHQAPSHLAAKMR